MATTAHGTLTADQVETVTVEPGRNGVVVVNRNQSGVIWVRLDGQDPQPEGAGSYAVFAVREFFLGRDFAYKPLDLRMLTDEDRPYTVEAY